MWTLLMYLMSLLTMLVLIGLLISLIHWAMAKFNEILSDMEVTFAVFGRLSKIIRRKKKGRRTTRKRRTS